MRENNIKFLTSFNRILQQFLGHRANMIQLSGSENLKADFIHRLQETAIKMAVYHRDGVG